MNGVEAEGDAAAQVAFESDEAVCHKWQRQPTGPTDEEIRADSETHEPYTSWCPSCIASRERTHGHSVQDHSQDAGQLEPRRQLARFAVPWHRRGRCFFRHRDPDTGVKLPMTRTEEESGGVGGLLGGCQQGGVFVDVAHRAVCRCARAASHGGAHHEAEWRIGTEGSGVGAHGEQVKEDVGEVIVELAVLPGEARSFGSGECDMTTAAATAVAKLVVEVRPSGIAKSAPAK